MSSKITPSAAKNRSAPSWQVNDSGPSVIRGDDPTFARFLGLVGAGFIILGGMPLLLISSGRHTPIGPGIAILLLSAGLLGLLFHAALDWDIQFRRIYMMFGFIVFALGVLLAVWPYPTHAGDQFLKGWVCLAIALLFLLAFLRNEDDVWFRNVTLNFLGGAAVVMAVVGLGGGNVKGVFLMPYGVLLGLLGLAYGTAYIMGRGVSDDRGYRAGLSMAALGVVVFVVALGRSTLPPLFHQFGWLSASPPKYWVPSGLLLTLLGAFYALTAVGLCSDNNLIVLAVRELGAQFCSPIAYIVMFAYVFAHWLAYWMFVGQMLEAQAPIPEPMIRGFILQWASVLFTIFIVPVLTMRLLSEEKRTGTLEVLLTAPVDESAVVASKFIAAWMMFLIIWLPFLLFLIALRVDGGQPFDYRPLFSFFAGLAVTGAGFVSMGVFFSSLTRNQIASGVLAFAGMLFLTLTFLLQGLFRDSVWTSVLKHMSFIDVWFDTLDGKLVPIRLIFFTSMAIFFLFVSVKVLEARKWA